MSRFSLGHLGCLHDPENDPDDPVNDPAHFTPVIARQKPGHFWVIWQNQ
jgi:hypothetical protein